MSPWQWDVCASRRVLWRPRADNWGHFNLCSSWNKTSAAKRLILWHSSIQTDIFSSCSLFPSERAVGGAAISANPPVDSLPPYGWEKAPRGDACLPISRTASPSPKGEQLVSGLLRCCYPVITQLTSKGCSSEASVALSSKLYIHHTRHQTACATLRLLSVLHKCIFIHTDAEISLNIKSHTQRKWEYSTFYFTLVVFWNTAYIRVNN